MSPEVRYPALQVTSYKLQGAGAAAARAFAAVLSDVRGVRAYQPQPLPLGRGGPSYKLQVTSYELQVTRYKLQVTSYTSTRMRRAASHKS